MSGRKSTKVEVTCNECTKQFLVTPSRSKYKTHYCSMTCKKGLTLESRFWRNIDKSSVDGCWPCKTDDAYEGYGKIHAYGKLWIASRLSWHIHFGEIPDGMFVCHHCDNPPCVRPDHLFLGTQLENMRDKHAKGRAVNPSGEDSCLAILTNEDVLKIFELDGLGYSSPRIESVVGKVSARYIRSILNGEGWSHLGLRRNPNQIKRISRYRRKAQGRGDNEEAARTGE